MSERILLKHRDLAAALAPDPGKSGETDLATLSAAVTSLLDSQSQYQPIVLVVDDLHHADEETRSLLRHTLYSLQKSPLLVVGTYPEDEVGRNAPTQRAARGPAAGGIGHERGVGWPERG